MVRREALALRKPVVVVTEIPQKAMLWRIAEPLESVCETRDVRIPHRRACHRPSVITNHHLVQGEAFLGAADEDVAPKFGDRDHHTGLTYEPGVRWSVIHDPEIPCHFARETWKATPQN